MQSVNLAQAGKMMKWGQIVQEMHFYVHMIRTINGRQVQRS